MQETLCREIRQSPEKLLECPTVLLLFSEQAALRNKGSWENWMRQREGSIVVYAGEHLEFCVSSSALRQLGDIGDGSEKYTA